MQKLEARGREVEVKLWREIAEEFRVSLTAAVLRFAELFKGIMAVILSKNNPEGMAFRQKIVWMACNKNFSYGKLNKNELIPLNTRTYDIYEHLMPTNYIQNQRIKKTGYRQFMKEKSDFLDSLEKTINVYSSDWFGNKSYAENGYLCQIDLPMTNYNSVLTVLWEGEE